MDTKAAAPLVRLDTAGAPPKPADDVNIDGAGRGGGNSGDSEAAPAVAASALSSVLLNGTAESVEVILGGGKDGPSKDGDDKAAKSGKPEVPELTTPARPDGGSAKATSVGRGGGASANALGPVGKDKSASGGRKKCQCRRKKCSTCHGCHAAHCTCPKAARAARSRPRSRGSKSSGSSRPKTAKGTAPAAAAAAAVAGATNSVCVAKSPARSSTASRGASTGPRESEAFDILVRCVESEVTASLVEVARTFRQKLDAYVRRVAKTRPEVSYSKDDVDMHTMRCFEAAWKVVRTGKLGKSRGSTSSVTVTRVPKAPAAKSRAAGSPSAFTKAKATKPRPQPVGPAEGAGETPAPPPKGDSAKKNVIPVVTVAESEAEAAANGLSFILEAMSSKTAARVRTSPGGSHRTVSTVEASAASALSTLAASAALVDTVRNQATMDGPPQRRPPKARSRSRSPKPAKGSGGHRPVLVGSRALSLSSSNESLADELSLALGAPTKRRSPLPPHILKPFKDDEPLRVPTPEVMLAEVLAVSASIANLAGDPPVTPIRPTAGKSPLRFAQKTESDALLSSGSGSTSLSTSGDEAASEPSVASAADADTDAAVVPPCVAVRGGRSDVAVAAMSDVDADAISPAPAEAARAGAQSGVSIAVALARPITVALEDGCAVFAGPAGNFAADPGEPTHTLDCVDSGAAVGAVDEFEPEGAEGAMAQTEPESHSEAELRLMEKKRPAYRDVDAEAVRDRVEAVASWPVAVAESTLDGAGRESAAVHTQPHRLLAPPPPKRCRMEAPNESDGDPDDESTRALHAMPHEHPPAHVPMS